MRDELLNETLFFGLDHARTRIADWADDYSSQRSNRHWMKVQGQVTEVTLNRNGEKQKGV